MRLADTAGLSTLAQHRMSIAGDKGANAGAKISSLVAGMVAGADSIDDMDLLRHGGMNRRSLRPGYNGLMAPTTFCNVMDLPAISVPQPGCRAAGDVRVPAVMLACAPGSEALLLDAAAALE